MLIANKGVDLFNWNKSDQKTLQKTIHSSEKKMRNVNNNNNNHR